MKTFIVTEGLTDCLLIKQLLPTEIRETVEVKHAGGKDSALSYSRSLLGRLQRPLALVIDADTNDEAKAKEKTQLYEDMLQSVSIGTKYKVLTAIPEIEIILFFDKEAFQSLLDTKVNNEIWLEAKFQPKAALNKLLKRNKFEDFVRRIDGETRTRLSRHPLVRDLVSFLMVVANRRHPA